MNVSQITIQAGEYAREEKRRARRGMAVFAAAAIVVALIVAGSSRTGTEPPPTPAPAQLAPLPPALTFDAQLAGTPSAAQLVRIRNSGDETLSVADVTAKPGSFRISNDCGDALAKNESCSAAVVFEPAESGEQSGELTVSTNGGTAAVALRGVARPIPPVNLGPLDFGSAPAGTPRPARTLRFGNSRPAAVVFGTASLSAPFVFAADACSGKSIEPGRPCDVEVAMPPGVTGGFKGELRLPDAYGDLVAVAVLVGETTAGQEIPPPKIDIVPPRVLEYGANANSVAVTNSSGRPVRVDVATEGYLGAFNVDTKTCSKVYEDKERCVITVAPALAMIYRPRPPSFSIVVRYEGRSEAVSFTLAKPR